MAIVQLPTVLPAQVGILPQRKRMVTTDNLATITAAGYLNAIDLQSNPIAASDVLDVLYSYNVNTGAGTYGIFTVSISNGVITLVNWANPGDVLLPVVSGDVPVFNGTTGQIKDSGVAFSNGTDTVASLFHGTATAGDFVTVNNANKTIQDSGAAPSAAAQPFVVMSPGSLTTNHIAQIADANGTIKDGGVLGTAAAKAASDNTKATLASVNGATIVNHIATYADTVGTISEDATTAINAGNIQAGLSGTQGDLIAYPAGALAGNLKLSAIGNTGDTSVTISNAIHGQATVYSIPDIGAATGGLVNSPTQFSMKSVAQAAIAGGAAAQTVTDAFCTTGSMVTASWNDTTNPVNIQTVAAGNGSFVVTSSADPGASHLNYIITK